MLFVCRVAFSVFFVPYIQIDGREECIGRLVCILNLGQVETVGQGKCFAVEARSADDEHFFFCPAGFQGFFQ